MSFVAVATVGAAAVGAAATISASNSASRAQDKATKAQTAASQADIQLAREQRDKNEQLFAPYLADEAQARAWADALSMGTGSYTPPGATTPVTITRDQVIQSISGTPLAQLAQTSYDQRQGITDTTYAGNTALANQEYGDLNSANDASYADSIAAADAARTGRNAQANQNLQQRLANNNAVFDAWNADATNQANKAIDLNFSRGGVTGLVGQTRAGVASVGQDYALQAAQQRAQLNADAYDPFYADTTNAENAYNTSVEGATDARGVNALNIAGNRANRNQTAFNNRQNSYASSLDQFEGDAANALGDYNSYLNNRVSAGRDAAGQIAAGGQAYVNSAANANNAAATAIANGAYNKAQVQQNLYSDISGIVGNAYSAFAKPQNAAKTTYNPVYSTPAGKPAGPYNPSSYSYSDPRLKTDVELIGPDADGLNWFRYRYLWDAIDAPKRVGVMATDAPEHAVTADANGFLMVDYSKLEAR